MPVIPVATVADLLAVPDFARRSRRSPPTPTRSPPTASAMASESTSRSRTSPRLLALAVLAAACSLAGARAAEPGRHIYQCERRTARRSLPTGRSPSARTRSSASSIPTARSTAIVAADADRRRARRAGATRARSARPSAAARNDAVRRDRNLMQRFPNEAAHSKARDKALDDLRAGGQELRGAHRALLTVERKKLEDEKEFYVNEQVNKPLPTKLKQKLDANDAALEAQRSLVAEPGSRGRPHQRALRRRAGAAARSSGPAPSPARSVRCRRRRPPSRQRRPRRRRPR